MPLRSREGPAPARALAAALLAAACGTLEVPDLATGSVAGRIPGSAAGAYVYVLGAQWIFTYGAADGSFRLDRVPAGRQRLVLFDGSAGAAAVDVLVRGASLAALPALPGQLPAAGGILAAVPLAGALRQPPAFTVRGTVLQGVPGPAAALLPLPAGDWEMQVDQPGFRPAVLRVSVAAGQQVAADLVLEVDGSSPQPGCNGCGGCEGSLACAPDGRCLACIPGAPCPGGTCGANGLCPDPAGGAPCAACASSADCPGGACILAGGETWGYCSRSCAADADCPAGFACQGSAYGAACLPKTTCSEMRLAFGAPCYKDDVCGEELQLGRCLGARAETPGFCTAPCLLDADCPSALPRCDPAAGHCVP